MEKVKAPKKKKKKGTKKEKKKKKCPYHLIFIYIYFLKINLLLI